METLVVTSGKDGDDSAFDREPADADVVISQPFWPAYPTAERIARALRLELAVTAGTGEPDAAIARGITVAEVTYCNRISVAEHVREQTPAKTRRSRDCDASTVDETADTTNNGRSILQVRQVW